MNKITTYKSLENNMVRYVDLIGVPVKPVEEKLEPISMIKNLSSKPVNNDMRTYTGEVIFVRKSVLTKLSQAADLLAKSSPQLRLQVVYGYRALSIQRKLFFKYKKQLEKKFTGTELLEATHQLIAVPEIAGHPTGGAVDIQIIKNGEPVDMGTLIWEFVKDSFTFSPFVSKEAQMNRQLLRQVMMQVGFAPFDGEWWHFSYGDKEWAKYYDKACAIYEQVEFRVVPKN